MHVRPARLADARTLHRWANDPVTRAVSFATGPIGWDEHLRWLRQVLADPDRILLVGEVLRTPIGAVRFDRRGDEAEVSITLAPEVRGTGLSRPLLAAALPEAGAPTVIAHVRADNRVSLRLFASWTCDGEVVERGVPVLRFRWEAGGPGRA